MRKFWMTAAIAAMSLVAGSTAWANGPCDQCNQCDPCGGSGGGRHRQRQSHHYEYEGRYQGFHCGCNGSYKFPVPPLYTYHWPGMYSAQLMTEYHSPWRFPPLKPYVDEQPLVEVGMEGNSLRATPVSTTARVVGEIEPMSSRLLRQQR